MDADGGDRVVLRRKCESGFGEAHRVWRRASRMTELRATRLRDMNTHHCDQAYEIADALRGRVAVEDRQTRQQLRGPSRRGRADLTFQST